MTVLAKSSAAIHHRPRCAVCCIDKRTKDIESKRKSQRLRVPVFRLVFMLVASGLFAERPGGFTVIGPGGGGAMYLPTISPHDPATAFVSCDMTGEYLTHDGGASWRMFNLRGRARF